VLGVLRGAPVGAEPDVQAVGELPVDVGALHVGAAPTGPGWA
jgi:hypothetical protein